MIIPGPVSLTHVFCDDPGTIANGSQSSNLSKFAYNDNIYYKCDKGYKLIGNSNRTCLASGKWSGESPRCKGKYSISITF